MSSIARTHTIIFGSLSSMFEGEHRHLAPHCCKAQTHGVARWTRALLPSACTAVATGLNLKVTFAYLAHVPREV